MPTVPTVHCTLSTTEWTNICPVHLELPEGVCLDPVGLVQSSGRAVGGGNGHYSQVDTEQICTLYNTQMYIRTVKTVLRHVIEQ